MRLLVAVTGALAAFSPATQRAQYQPSIFVITSGPDTVAVEQFTHDRGSVSGDLRIPQLQPQGEAHMHYDAHLRLDGSAETVKVLNDMRGFFTGTIAFDATARATARAGGGALADRVLPAPPNSYPVVGVSIALMEQLLRATHPAPGDSVQVPVLNVRNRYGGTATIRRISADSVVILCEGCMRQKAVEVLRLAVAKNGDITGGVGTGDGDFTGAVAKLPGWTITRR